MCILLCFSQNFVNELVENKPNARLEAVAHPTGGYRVIVTHQIQEEQFENFRKKYPDVKQPIRVEDGQGVKHLFYELARIHYHPLPEWKKRLGLSA